MCTSGLSARTPPYQKRAPDLTTDESQPVFAWNRTQALWKNTRHLSALHSHPTPTLLFPFSDNISVVIHIRFHALKLNTFSHYPLKYWFVDMA